MIYAPRLAREKKVRCAELMTHAFAESTGLEAELLTIHFEEHSYDNIAVGGRLLTDVEPELATRDASYSSPSQ